MQFGHVNLRFAGIGAILALVLAACTASGDTGGGADGDLSIAFVNPTDGAEVEPGFELQVESNVPLDAPETGERHVHFYYDTDINSADYQIVYGDSATIDRELTPGEHTIIASLRNADHSDAGPMDEITVTVGEGEASSAADATDGADAAASDDPGFFDY